MPPGEYQAGLSTTTRINFGGAKGIISDEVVQPVEPSDSSHPNDLIKRLYAVTTAFSETVSQQDVARVAVDQGIAAAGATAGSIALLSDDGKMLKVIRWIGFPPEMTEKWSQFPIEAKVPLAQAVASATPIYLTTQQERLARYPQAAQLNANEPTRSSACLPLIIAGRTVGGIGFSFNGERDFTPQEKDFLVSLSRQCAQALERARLFESQRELTRKYEQQSRLFEQIASTTPDLFYVFDLNGRFTYANRRLLELWGTTLEDAMGKSLYELAYPQWHADMHMREITQVIQTKQPIKGEVPFTGGSGISGVFEYIFTPVLGEDGQVEAIAGTTRDVTERKINESRTARDALLLGNVQDAVIVSDLNGVVTFWNEGATHLFGWTAQEMVNRPYYDRFPDHARQQVKEWISRVAVSGGESSGEWNHYRKDGSRIWIEGTIRRIVDSPLLPPCLMGVCRDISDRKRSESEREQLLISERAARADAERASRMKDEFLATLSHELRTPLNAILGWATILAGGAQDPVDLHEGLETIKRNARAQTQIIEDLLDMSRIISGKVRLEVQPTYLSSIVQSAVDTVKPTADAKGVRLNSVLDTSAGPISGDPARLQQVFWNLLNNAVKFTPRGGQVQARLARVSSHVEVTVSDTGEGIKPEFLPHVFDRFRQADASTTRRHGGLGLGLAIVKQLVELHGGTVVAKSPGVGQGSTFAVRLPLTVLHADALDDSSQQARRAIGGTLSEDCLRLAGLKVLVVDDEPDARGLVKRLLEDCGAVVQAAGSAQAALEMIATNRPEVLISDIGMPGEDGYSLIRRVRTLGPDKGADIPAVALTAYARTEDRVRAIRAGFQSHLVKPVDPTELITIVGSLAGRIAEDSGE